MQNPVTVVSGFCFFNEYIMLILWSSASIVMLHKFKDLKNGRSKK